MTYQFKSKPYEHQRVCFELSKDLEIFGILFEMGAGKSKVIIDTAAYLYSLGRINCLVVLAPNGVHKKWLREDVPFNLPDHIEFQAAVWQAGNKESMQACEDLLKPGDHLRILLANIEGMSWDSLPKFLHRILLATDALVCVDESTRIKNPSSIRYKKLQKLKHLMKYRRILTGAMVVNKPFDVFAQFGFLSEDILGASYPAFKAQYAEILPAGHPMVQAIMRKTHARFPPQIAAKGPDGKDKYRNLDKLREIIAPYCMRVEKKDCLDLPPKIYETRYYQLTPEQRKIYEQIDKDFKFEWGDKTVSIVHKLTKALRLQQLVDGFVVNAEGDLQNFFAKPDDNPRIQLLLETLEDIEGPVIIWCRFQEEIRQIARILGPEAVTYYGERTDVERETALKMFQAGEKRYFVGTPQTGGIGLNLSVSYTMVYYSNTFNAEDRWQSEDRIHRIGQEADKVLYIDLQAENTIDETIVQSLRAKKDLSEYLHNLPTQPAAVA